jgi:hypothetical protein
MDRARLPTLDGGRSLGQRARPRRRRCVAYAAPRLLSLVGPTARNARARSPGLVLSARALVDRSCEARHPAKRLLAQTWQVAESRVTRSPSHRINASAGRIPTEVASRRDSLNPGTCLCSAVPAAVLRHVYPGCDRGRAAAQEYLGAGGWRLLLDRNQTLIEERIEAWPP